MLPQSCGDNMTSQTCSYSYEHYDNCSESELTDLVGLGRLLRLKLRCLKLRLTLRVNESELQLLGVSAR